MQNVKWTPVQNNRQVGNQSQEPTTEQTQTQIKEDQLINLKLEEDIRHSIIITIWRVKNRTMKTLWPKK